MVGKTRCTAMVIAALVLIGVSAGCADFFYNQTASLGGDTAGDRGSLEVLVINNTPYRAVFTLGTYDQTDVNTQPDIRQFGNDDDLDKVEGETQTGLLDPQCGRVFAVGSPTLLDATRANPPDEFDPYEDALVEGVAFYEIDADTGEAVYVGSAPALEARLGVDFPCGALLILHYEIDDFGPEPFRIDFELIPAASTR